MVEELIREQRDLFVVDVTLKGHQGNQRLEVSLDGDSGVNIDQCAEVSRRLGHQIEESNMIDGKYILEVSSAGMGRPLKVMRQFKKNQGRELEVALKNGETVTGGLIDSNDEGLKLLIDDKEEEIAFIDIDKSRVLVSFK